MPKNVRIWNNELNQTWTPGVVFEDLSGLQSVSHVPTMFAAEVARSNPHRIVYLINVSYSAQSIDKWLDNNSDPDMHAAIRENVNAALSTLPGKSTIDLFLWWQGESDRWESELYKDRWDEMINDLKNEDWFMPETPELIFWTNTSDNPISPAPNTDIDNMIPVFQEIVSDKPWHRKYIHTNDLEFSDGVHLSGQGQLDAAKRAYNIYEYGFTYRADLAAGTYTETPNKFVDGTDSSDAVYMNGNVWIGTTMPDAKLAIDAPNSHIKLKDNNNESTDVGQVISIQGYWSDGVRNFFIGDGSSLRNDLRIKSDNNSITLETTESDNLVIDGTTGNVGVGTNSISNAAKLQINGSVKIGQSSLDCDSSTAWAIRYNVSINKHQGCNSTSWVDLY